GPVPPHSTALRRLPRERALRERLRLPVRRRERLARPPAERQDDRAVRAREPHALGFRIADVDERAARRVDLVAGDGERRVAAEHDVELLVTSRPLLVALDHLVAVRAAPRVDAEGLDVEVV